ncbi:MAG: TRAP transporter small permease [Burkholderiales bacterium]|nr:TRAP transporter small permease [Burkholderiales bacterium]
MRVLLDWLYRASGALAAAFLVAIALVVLAQVGANLVDALIKAFGGEPYGLLIPSYAEFAGFFLAASSFFALAYTLRHGAHIRVELLVHRLGPRARHWVELWCVAVATVVSGYFAWYSFGLVRESFEFGDPSPGIIAIPLWIPQSGMALGLAVLTIAFTDDLVALLRGRVPSYGAAVQGSAAEHE